MAFDVLEEQPFDICTYFIQVAPRGPIKIGRSTDPASRYQSIQASVPFPLIPLLLLPGNHERGLHWAFDAHRINGEWFKPVSGIAKLITSLIPSDPDYLRIGGRETIIGRVMTKVEVSHLAHQIAGAKGRRETMSLREEIRQGKRWIRNII